MRIDFSQIEGIVDDVDFCVKLAKEELWFCCQVRMSSYDTCTSILFTSLFKTARIAQLSWVESFWLGTFHVYSSKKKWIWIEPRVTFFKNLYYIGTLDSSIVYEKKIWVMMTTVLHCSIIIVGVTVGLKNWLRITLDAEPSVIEDGLRRIKAFSLRHAKMP